MTHMSCCEHDCIKDAKWGIYPEPAMGEDDYTHSCAEHLDVMIGSFDLDDRLSKDTLFRVIPIEDCEGWV